MFVGCLLYSCPPAPAITRWPGPALRVLALLLNAELINLPRDLMSDIHIHRNHTLGLAKARKVAWAWAEQVETQFDMECTVLEGKTSDTVAFTRTGVKGQLTVAADHFDLTAQLGFLLGAFSKTIEREIEKNLDALLKPAAASATSAKKTKSK